MNLACEQCEEGEVMALSGNGKLVEACSLGVQDVVLGDWERVCVCVCVCVCLLLHRPCSSIRNQRSDRSLH